MLPSPGSHIGVYEVAAQLGAGGMGVVYRARDPKLGRDVAIKFLPESFGADPGRLARFAQEARVLAALNHPNILTIHDLGLHQDRPYLVMELLEGSTLRDSLDGKPQPVRRVLEIAQGIAEGLAAAHAKGVIHRDLKPENIFLTRDGRVKLLDFGLAKAEPPMGRCAEGEAPTESLALMAPLTEAGVVLGTVGYMSPEQVRGAPVDARSDLFSFGVVVWEMLTGRRPFTGPSAVEVMSAILAQEPPELDPELAIPPGLCRILEACLAKEPTRRLQNAHDLSFALGALLALPSGGARTEAGPPRKARPGLRWLGLVGAVVGVAGLGIFLWARARAPAHPTFHRLTFLEGRICSARFIPGGQEALVTTTGPDWMALELGRLRLDTREWAPVGLKGVWLHGLSPDGEVVLARRTGVYSHFAATGTAGIAHLGALAPRYTEGAILGADLSREGVLAVARLSPSGRYRLECPPGTVRVDNGSDFSDLRFSSDGRMLGCIERTIPWDSAGCVGLLDLQTGTYRRLTGIWSNVFGLAWKDDEVWFTASSRGDQKALFAVSRGGRERTLAAPPADLTLLDVRADGRVLLGTESFASRLYVMSEGGSPREVTACSYPVAQGITPDGSKFLYLSNETRIPLEYDLFLKPVAGGPTLRLGTTTSYSALSPDGSRVVAIKGSPLHPVLIPVGFGTPKDLPSGGLAAYESLDPRWTADGRAFVTIGRRPGEATRAWIQDAETGQMSPYGPAGSTWVLPAPPGGRMLARIGGAWFLADPADPSASPVPAKGIGARDPLFGQFLGWDREGTRVLIFEREGCGVSILRVDPVTGRSDVWKRFATPDIPPRAPGSPPRLTPDGRTAEPSCSAARAGAPPYTLRRDFTDQAGDHRLLGSGPRPGNRRLVPRVIPGEPTRNGELQEP